MECAIEGHRAADGEHIELAGQYACKLHEEHTRRALRVIPSHRQRADGIARRNRSASVIERAADIAGALQSTGGKLHRCRRDEEHRAGRWPHDVDRRPGKADVAASQKYRPRLHIKSAARKLNVRGHRGLYEATHAAATSETHRRNRSGHRARRALLEREVNRDVPRGLNIHIARVDERAAHSALREGDARRVAQRLKEQEVAQHRPLPVLDGAVVPRDHAEIVDRALDEDVRPQREVGAIEQVQRAAARDGATRPRQEAAHVYGPGPSQPSVQCHPAAANKRRTGNIQQAA